MDKFTEAKNRLKNLNDIESIKINNMTMPLIKNDFIIGNKGVPIGQYQIYALRKDTEGDETYINSSIQCDNKSSKNKGLDDGSIVPVGNPACLVEPSTEELVGSSSSIPLTIGYNSKWSICDNHRNLLSYQFFTAIKEQDNITYYGLIIYPYAIKFSLSRCLSLLLEYLWKNHHFVYKPARFNKSKSPDPSSKTTDSHSINIQLVSHFGCADIPNFYNGIDQILKKLIKIQKTVVSSSPVSLNIVDNNKNIHHASISFRDTMLLAETNSSLDDIGKSLKIDRDETNYISNMGSLLLDHPMIYTEHALCDAYINLAYSCSLNFGVYHNPLPKSIGSEACKIIKTGIMKNNHWTDAEFNLNFRGLVGIKRSNGKSSTGHICYSTSLEPTINSSDLLDTSLRCYLGGFNSALFYGFYEGTCYDYDLSGAYPSALSMSPDIDFTKTPSIYTGDITSLIDASHPCDYGFGIIDFEFPADLKYPCIPFYDVNGHGLINTLKGSTYASHPEVFLAVKLGAKITAQKWIIPKTTNIYSLKGIFTDLTNKRNKLKNEFGIKSPQEQLQKLINNSGYGNLARGLSDKKGYSLSNNKSEILPPSSITSAPYASHVTSLIRAIILASMNGIYDAGYVVLHATTDGFMSNIPYERLSSMPLYGFTDAYRSTLKSMTGSESMWEVKHQAELNIVLRTRCNVGISESGNGNLARAGYKLTLDESVLSQPDQCLEMAHKFFSRTGSIASVSHSFPSMRDIIQKGKDYVVYEQTTNLNVDWDWKRKLYTPVEKLITIKGLTYTHICATTEPFQTMDEYSKYKKAAGNITLLKTTKDYNYFLICLANTESNTRNTGSGDKNIARSLLRYIRTNKLTGFEGLSGVVITEKIGNLLNVILTPNDYKKANIEERNKYVLPREFIDPYLTQLGLSWKNCTLNKDAEISNAS